MRGQRCNELFFTYFACPRLHPSLVRRFWHYIQSNPPPLSKFLRADGGKCNLTNSLTTLSSNLSSPWNWTAILQIYNVYRFPLSKEKRMAIASVIFGIISVVSYFGLPGIITSLIGLFLTYRARSNAASNQMLVKIGFLLNGFFLLMGLYYQFS